MAQINRSDDATNLGPGQLQISQGDFREQQDAIGDSLRMLGGLAELEPGDGTVNNPLNAPFKLYVDPYIGDDALVSGSYVWTDDGSREQELSRIESQRLRCGYTEARPFRTLNRAIIEAGLITSKDYFDAVEQEDMRVCIHMLPGVHTLLCGAGNNANQPAVLAANFGEVTWTNDQLQWFNPNPVPGGDNQYPGGGIILPRGCSVISLDLRKTILRPDEGWVPGAVADEQAPNANSGVYPNRRALLRMTGEGYYYGLTFMDAVDGNGDIIERSHHLMSCFEFATVAQLNEFYTKLDTIFTNQTTWEDVGAWNTEGQIVGPQPINGQTEATDTTASASPYIYNCSIRSEYGLAGLFANRGIPGQASAVAGFGSAVLAQYTGVSLQKDMNCWQRYNGGTDRWEDSPTYGNFIDNTDPDDIRQNPDRRSFHIRAVNRAVLQEVSVFAIGQGVHHWVESGGEITITNSNSNWGGVSALAEGFQDFAYPTDSNNAVDNIQVATDLTEETGNVRDIFLGTINATNGAAGSGAGATVITLDDPLAGENDNEPELVFSQGYTLREGSWLWVEAPGPTPDYRGQCANVCWDAVGGNPAQLTVQAAFVNQNGDAPQDGLGANRPSLIGARVYIRRLRDTRTVDERTYALRTANPVVNSRRPVRDYIVQPSNGNGEFANITAVQKSQPDDNSINGALLSLKRIQPNADYTQNRWYPRGVPLNRENKHWICTTEHWALGAAPNLDNFSENFAHMEEGYDAEDFFKNVQPVIVFDNDTDGDEDTDDCGFILDATNANSCWRLAPNFGGNANEINAALVQGQYRFATDYLGLHQFLVDTGNYGNAAAVHTFLLPQPAADRNLVRQGNQALGIRRPSMIRAYGMAYEWAGWTNYTRALPQYQGQMTTTNKFTYYATNQEGGRVYFTGFNEEGFSVSPAGITDIETQETLSVENIDQTEQTITFIDNLTVNNLTVVTGITGPLHTIANDGLSQLASAAQAQTSGFPAGTDPSDVTAADVDTAVDASQRTITPPSLEWWKLQRLANGNQMLNGTASTAANVNDNILDDGQIVTPTGLEWWADDRNFAIAVPEGIQYLTLHVCRVAANIRVGAASVPFGFPEGDTTPWAAGGTVIQNTIFTNLDDAFRRAERIQLPQGAFILISVHDDLSNNNTITEAGPLVLGNSTARVIVAGCRNPNGVVPAIRVNRNGGNTTENALAFIPQYATTFSFSCGVVFADMTIHMDCSNLTRTALTFNGGFGVGGRDLILNLIDMASDNTLIGNNITAAATCGMGGSIAFQLYAPNTVDRAFTVNFISHAGGANDIPRFEMFSSMNSGILGSGATINFDARNSMPATAGGSFTFRYNRAAGYAATPAISWINLGNRGGTVMGSRRAAVYDFDFSNDNFNLEEWVGRYWTSSTNMQGEMFSVTPCVTPAGTYNMSAATLASFRTITAIGGFQCEINDQGGIERGGPFGLLHELEGQAGLHASVTGALYRANNTCNAYFHYDTRGTADTDHNRTDLGWVVNRPF